jgi:hypothetical protein
MTLFQTGIIKISLHQKYLVVACYTVAMNSLLQKEGYTLT